MPCLMGDGINENKRASMRMLGYDCDESAPAWVGPRPVTPDGRALIGELSPNVYVAGGHGMWGLAHGPVTGRP